VILRALAILFTCPVASAYAQEARADLMNFMSGQGCTFAPASEQAAQMAGFTQADLDVAKANHLAEGTASQQGGHVVLDETVCTIGLPVIASK
jgi:hypothetical protein